MKEFIADDVPPGFDMRWNTLAYYNKKERKLERRIHRLKVRKSKNIMGRVGEAEVLQWQITMLERELAILREYKAEDPRLLCCRPNSTNN